MPYVFDDKDPRRITELDYVQIGKAIHGGYVEALGAGFYAIAGRYTHEDLTAFLIGEGHPTVYVTHVTYTDGTTEDYTGSVDATLAWIASRNTIAEQVIASFTTGTVILMTTEGELRESHALARKLGAQLAETDTSVCPEPYGDGEVGS